MWLFGEIPPSVFFATGAAIVGFFLIRRMRISLFSPRKFEPPQVDLLAPLTIAETPVEVLRGQVQLHDTAREVMAELDSKMSGLQSLARIADEATARLEAAIARAEKLGLSARRDVLDEIANVSELDDEAVGRLAERTPADLHRRIDTASLTAQRIREMARGGRSPAAIAAELYLPLGDVELLLSLPPR